MVAAALGRSRGAERNQPYLKKLHCRQLSPESDRGLETALRVTKPETVIERERERERAREKGERERMV